MTPILPRFANFDFNIFYLVKYLLLIGQYFLIFQLNFCLKIIKIQFPVKYVFLDRTFYFFCSISPTGKKIYWLLVETSPNKREATERCDWLISIFTSSNQKVQLQHSRRRFLYTDKTESKYFFSRLLFGTHSLKSLIYDKGVKYIRNSRGENPACQAHLEL